MSKANSANGKGNSFAVIHQENPPRKKETPMSFHKIAPVKPARKAAPAPHHAARPAPKHATKKAAPKPRPVGRQGR